MVAILESNQVHLSFLFHLSPFYFIIFSNNNPNSMHIYQYVTPMSTSLEQPESMILISSYELHPCLVAIGQNQPFSIAEVLSFNQEDKEILATLGNLLIFL